MNDFSTAHKLIKEFKGERYLNGLDILPQVGRLAAEWLPAGSRKLLLVCDDFPGSGDYVITLRMALETEGFQILAEVPGAAPNAPREDLARITGEVMRAGPELLVSFGGGSTIDAVKASGVLAVLGKSVDSYFGTGLVTKELLSTGKQLLPHLAIQTAASSSAHLTKYSNITDRATGQKKLIVDEAIIPERAAFDYKVTLTAPASLVGDGAMDGLSHALEVLYSAVGKPIYERVLPVALETIRLVIHYLPVALKNPRDLSARQALGLATDLGGYCIMLGGTNGAHLTSFSLVNILSHGRACGMLNPYYTVFFAPAVESALSKVASVYHSEGYLASTPRRLKGRKLGLQVAEGMLSFAQSVGFPTCLSQVPGFTEGHIAQALAAAKDPQLRMKLENMPVPMTAEMVDRYMAPILMAAKTGQLDLIQNVV